MPADSETTTTGNSEQQTMDIELDDLHGVRHDLELVQEKVASAMKATRIKPRIQSLDNILTQMERLLNQ
jgi:hypothetical protein